jgi:pilus assembly protein CpaB
VAISIPINRLDAVAYAIRDGDRVNIIATTLFVDLDASFQSVLPNLFGQVVNVGVPPDGAPLITLGMNNGGGGGRTAGRAELDPTLNQAIYYIPSEPQRPRLVSQMVLQDIQVLHVGTFSLTEANVDQATPNPSGGNPPASTAVPVARPDIITLIVTPQDAVSITYMLYSGVKLTLTLRAPDDTTRAETEAATLQYLLSQYAIPVPAKLPYGIEPRINFVPIFAEVTATPRP